jgi:FlaA1/EpsC-like NDP-sugar epimerase
MPRKFPDLSQVRRLAILLSIYGFVIATSFYVAYEVRFDFLVAPEFQTSRLAFIGLVIGLKLLALVWAGQLGSMLTFFSIPDFLRLFWAMVGASLVLFIPRLLLGNTDYAPPRGVLLVDFLLCFGGLCGLRLAVRLYRERITMSRKLPAVRQERIAIVGAGDAGASLAQSFINTPSRGFRPVVFLDDDPLKHGQLVHGVPVFGKPEQLPECKEAADITKVVIAIPSAHGRRVREIALFLAQQGYKVEIMPALEELASGRAKVSRIRPVEVQDLLGRDPVNLDSAAIRQFVEGRVVMVTGAGGSIGSELCRQIARLNPQRLLMLEQCEGSLFLIEQELNELGLGAIALALVADILDEARIDYLFTRYKPQVLFHAAAHKHVYMMERQPAEAIRNNAVGTRTLARAAAQHGVEAFVFISTDKAINPTSLMGVSKRLAELHLQALAGRNGQRGSEGVGEKGSESESESERGGGRRAEDGTGNAQLPTSNIQRPSSGSETSVSAEPKLAPAATKFMAVRFGNVLGSSGSVVPIFKRQIEKGGPVTVTHPDVTRYFMTIPEAVGLVLQASVLGRGGEIFVLNMGQPVKIVDLARQMIELSGFKAGDDIEIKFIGLKPGEKLYEELQHRDEQHEPTEHPCIMRFVCCVDAQEASKRAIVELESRLYQISSNDIKRALQKIVPEYTPFFE